MSADQALYAGVDVGGTKILALVVTADGQILGRKKLKTSPEGSLAAQVAAAVEEALGKAGATGERLAAMGVAMPAVVDSRAGLVVHAPNLANADAQLRAQLAQRFPVPVFLGNDVNLGTLAEVWRGAGQGADSVVGIFVGTGIGGGVVIGGRLLVGAEDQAGEIGHMVLSVDGPVCGCGNRGCYEALASRTAIERDLREALAAGRASSLREAAENGRVTSGALAAALAEGDELATEIMTRVGRYLGQGIVSLRHVVNPELVILGGGVMEACSDFLMPLIEAEVHGDCLRRSREVMRLAVSQLGDDAVALGAAALAHAESATAEACPAPGEVAAAKYPRLDRVAFGAAVVDGKERAGDLYIRANGKVKARKKQLARERYGTSHVLGAEELAKVLKGSPSLLIIGAGFQSRMRLDEEAEAFLRARGVEWHLLPSPEAVEAFNQAPGRKALFLHVTC